MIRFKINKGKHYPRPFPWFLPIWVKKNSGYMRKAFFKFTESCLFDLVDEDQHDVNKLFGFSIGHHHRGSSFRFGWRPILDENKIEIVAYEYHDGIRQKTMSMGLVDLNTWYKARIFYLPHLDRSYYHFGDLEFGNEFVLKKKWGLGYTLSIYFGGNEKAPQDIIIYRKN